MDAAALALSAFNSIPSWTKTSVTFSRTVQTSYDPITGIVNSTTLTATAPCVSQARVHRGTLSEGLVDGLAVREKALILTVPAEPLNGFLPQADDQATVNGELFQVTGTETISPGSTVAVYRITVSR